MTMGCVLFTYQIYAAIDMKQRSVTIIVVFPKLDRNAFPKIKL